MFSNSCVSSLQFSSVTDLKTQKLNKPVTFHNTLLFCSRNKRKQLLIYLFKAAFSSAFLNFFNSKSKCSLHAFPTPYTHSLHTVLSSVEKITYKARASVSHSSALFGRKAITSLHNAMSCSNFGQRNGDILCLDGKVVN